MKIQFIALVLFFLANVLHAHIPYNQHPSTTRLGAFPRFSPIGKSPIRTAPRLRMTSYPRVWGAGHASLAPSAAISAASR